MAARHRTRSSRRLPDGPVLASPCGELPAQLAAAASAELWEAAERAEEEFDYEGARDLYREAVRRTRGSDRAERLERYAAFLVERYGQFEEVAAWLDDPDFDPLAGAPAHQTPALARHLAAAAAETGHPRGPELDLVLARTRGEPRSLGRAARRLLDAGGHTEARELLEKHARRLEPHGEAATLLAELRDRDECRAAEALGVVTRSLDRDDLEAAEGALDELREGHGTTAAFRSLAARLHEARSRRRTDALEAGIDAALAAEDFDAALRQARELAALDPVRAERVQEVHRLVRLHALDRALMAMATLEAGTRPAFAALADLLAAHGERIMVPEHLEADWTLLKRAAAAGAAVGEHPEDLVELRRAASLLAAGDLDGVAALAAELPLALTGIEPIAGAMARLRERDRERRKQAEARCLEAVRGALAADDIEAAERALRRHIEAGGERTAPVRRAQHEFEELRRVHAHRERLVREVHEAMGAGRLHDARRRLRALADFPEAARRANELGAELRARLDRELRAEPVPPFGLKIDAEELVMGVAAGRMAVVQDRLWLTVNLETRGLAPFRLPETCALDPDRPCRIAPVGEALRLVGFAGERLVVIDQEPGFAPVVTEARALAELTGGAELAAAALEPAGRTWTLLTRERSRGRLIRIDPKELEPLDARHHRPRLSALVAIEHTDAVLVSSEAEERPGRGWAMARYDGGRDPTATWNQEQLQEPIAAPIRAIAWPEQERIFCRYATFDLLDPGRVVVEPSLLVFRGGKPIFATSDLRRRFAPTEKLQMDHAWCLDPAHGRLWFAALPRHDAQAEDALLLGVNARTLRADSPLPVPGAKRLLALEPLADGAAALCMLQDGKLAVARVATEGGRIDIRLDKLPV